MRRKLGTAPDRREIAHLPHPKDIIVAKILLVLYPDPVAGYPPVYARDSIPVLRRYPDGQSLPTPSAIDFTPGELPGSVSGELGLRTFVEAAGHELVVTSDKERSHSVFNRELADAEIVISQPCWPAHLTAERIANAPRLRLAITAGVGSDHIDVDAAMAAGITVTEVTYSNTISVSEHTVMQILALLHDYPRSHEPIVDSGWNIADSVRRSYDLEGMDVGIISAGRTGLAVLRRLAPFDVNLHYTDRLRLPAEIEHELGLTFHPEIRSLVRTVDVISIHAPLHPQTYHLFDDDLIRSMRRGSYIVNSARSELVVRDAVVRALRSGQLAGYAGDVWPHVSGSTLSAQARSAAGVREILEDWFACRPIREEYLIVDGSRHTGESRCTNPLTRSPGAPRP